MHRKKVGGLLSEERKREREERGVMDYRAKGSPSPIYR
jgi:hypothetical protein